MSVSLRRSVPVVVAMVMAAAAALLMTPDSRMGDKQAIVLKDAVPTQFGDWREDTRQWAAVVNPQEGELASKLYQQVLARTYVHLPTRRSVMLSVAYGANQSRSHDLHVPEICYPASGFRIESSAVGQILADGRAVPVKRLVTARLERREPLTYWAVIGERATTGAVSSKLIALSYGLRGTVPDGIIFRVSSVGQPDHEAFKLQEEFVRSLLATVSPDVRARLSGSL